jgi:hypothetical protein
MGRTRGARIEAAVAPPRTRAGVGYGPPARLRLVSAPPPARTRIDERTAIAVVLLGVCCGAAIAPGLFVGQYFFVSAIARSVEWVLLKAAADFSPSSFEGLVTFVGHQVLTDAAFLGQIFSGIFAGLALAGALSGYAGATLSLLVRRHPVGGWLVTSGVGLLAVLVSGPGRWLVPSLPPEYALFFWPSLLVLVFVLTCTIGFVTGEHTSRAAGAEAGRRP